MRKSVMALTVAFGSLFLTGNAVLASDQEKLTPEQIEQYDKEFYENREGNGFEEVILKHRFEGEQLLGNRLVRTYIEEGTTDEIWYTIELPEEVLKQVEKIEKEDEKIEKIYELMSNLYVETDSWLKLNILAQQANDLYPVEDILISNDQKKEVSKKTAIIIDAIGKKGEIEALEIANKEMFTDTEAMKETYKFLPFDSVEESKEVLKEEMKELKTQNVFALSVGIILILAIILGTLFIKRKGR